MSGGRRFSTEPKLKFYVQLKPKYLNNITLPFPEVHASNVGEPVARITAGKKQRQYDVTLVPHAAKITGDIGGEEMKAMKCLLPRKAKGGKLFLGVYSRLASRLGKDVIDL